MIHIDQSTGKVTNGLNRLTELLIIVRSAVSPAIRF